ncbi:MAG: PTS-dependent dihydroxyacetone kinase phosphotransferase subunit DhaM [Erysipelothrix sp.]|nr:PTS-dependent dihydroxyacetone kinase phosphotransferase subunit DhaM [Erysipelothrix sp.]
MVSVLLVSHSRLITDGLKQMIEEMTGRNDSIQIHSCGGSDDGGIGTDPTFILETIEESSNSDVIYLFGDLGSGLLSIETALDLIDDDPLRDKCHYIDAPLVEGSFIGSVQCLVDPSVEAVRREIRHYIDTLKS